MEGAWFDWIDGHPLGEAATVSVAAGVSLEQALAAFGADPLCPTPAPPADPRRPGVEWVDGGTVLAVAIDGGIVAVEPNGWQGTRPEVLRRLSAAGRAASWYYSVEARRRLAVADSGQLLADFDPGVDQAPTLEVVSAALNGLDIDDWHNGWGLEALRRITGQGFTRAVFDQMITTGVRYPIVPHLEDLQPWPRQPDGTPVQYGEHGPLGPDTDDLLKRLSEVELRELAWWAAAEVATHFGATDDPAVLTTLATRAMSPHTEWLARTGTRSDGHELGDPRVWTCLRHATNPDAYNAATSNLSVATYLFQVAYGAEAGGWVDRARNRLT